MMGLTFFESGVTASDVVYKNIRDGQDFPVVRARRFLEHSWKQAAQFIDKGARAKAKDDLQAVWWELYLAVALSRIGKQVCARTERTPQNEGPDLLVDHNVWIEANMPGNGTGPDAIVKPKLNVAYSISREQMVLRLLSGIDSKKTQFRAHYRSYPEHVRPGDRKVIAISGGRLEFRFQEPHTPWIVQAAYGLGNMVFSFNRETMERVDAYVEQEAAITKASGASVHSGVFTTPENMDISAILYSCSDCANFPDEPGGEFVLVHNPYATNPLPTAWLGVGTEYTFRLDKQAYTRVSYGGYR